MAGLQQMVLLEIRRGPEVGRRLQLPVGIVRIGRAAECEVCLPSPRVSRQHCVLDVTSSQVSVRAVSPQNPTLLDGAPLRAGQALPPQCLLTLADVVLLVQHATAAAAPGGPRKAGRVAPERGAALAMASLFLAASFLLIGGLLRGQLTADIQVPEEAFDGVPPVSSPPPSPMQEAQELFRQVQAHRAEGQPPGRQQVESLERSLGLLRLVPPAERTLEPGTVRGELDIADELWKRALATERRAAEFNSNDQ